MKTALDETRMLILGAQVLIGFQFQFAFGEAFNKLPVALRHLNEVSLVLMMIVVALLVAPSAHAPRSERLQE